MRGIARRARRRREDGARLRRSPREMWVNGLFTVVSALIVTLGTMSTPLLSSDNTEPHGHRAGCGAHCAHDGPPHGRCSLPGRHTGGPPDGRKDAADPSIGDALHFAVAC
ncbi:hypothetical protein AAH991_23730 [Microbispora sp. ZYX-F-249]|uniref:Uncharacterized protein n=1 Tax=Microbispora maris TaxID=3144104 RepID=A0ABV0AS91_9ACTN